MRCAPSFQLSRVPALQSWPILARVIPSSEAASEAVIAGTPMAERSIAIVTTRPPWRAIPLQAGSMSASREAMLRSTLSASQRVASPSASSRSLTSHDASSEPRGWRTIEFSPSGEYSSNSPR